MGFYRISSLYETDLPTPQQDLGEGGAKTSAASTEAPLASTTSDSEAIELGDFEIIEFDEICSRSSTPSSEQAEMVSEICEVCHSEWSRTLSAFCGHKFCEKCLRVELMHRATSNGGNKMECLIDGCTSGLKMHTLQLVLPLPVANLYSLIYFDSSYSSAKDSSWLHEECLQCKQYVVAEQMGIGRSC